MSRASRVCDACVFDQALRALVDDNAEPGRCDFCGRRTAVADARVLLEHIHQTFAGRWTPHVEPGERYATTAWGAIFGLRELLEHERQPAFAEEAFERFVLEAFADTLWTPSTSALGEAEALAFSWRLFKQVVRFQTRFFFAGDGGRDPGDELWRGRALLDEVGRLIRVHGLVRSAAAGTRVYRIRLHAPAERPATAAELGAPPARRAAPGRMTAAGMTALYGAFELTTAEAETLRPGTAGATLGVWETTRAMTIVDLERVPPIPSLFDHSPASIAIRPSLLFMHELRADLRQPMTHDDPHALDYVPTQVLGDYLRHLFTDDDGHGVDGVLWESARMLGGRSLALFVESRDCVDLHAPATTDRLCLRLLSSQQVRPSGGEAVAA